MNYFIQHVSGTPREDGYVHNLMNTYSDILEMCTSRQLSEMAAVFVYRPGYQMFYDKIASALKDRIDYEKRLLSTKSCEEWTEAAPGYESEAALEVATGYESEAALEVAPEYDNEVEEKE